MAGVRGGVAPAIVMVVEVVVAAMVVVVVSTVTVVGVAAEVVTGMVAAGVLLGGEEPGRGAEGGLLALVGRGRLGASRQRRIP